MKDFIFICIMCGAFVAFVGGLVYAHISWAKEQIKKAYERGYAEGRADDERRTDRAF